MRLSLLDSLLVPLQAVVHAQRVLAESALRRIRSALWQRRGGIGEPVMFELPLPRPAAQRIHLRAPLLALRPSSQLSVSQTKVEWVWCLDQVVMPGPGNSALTAQLMGRSSPPAHRRRPSDRSAGVDVEVNLRRLEPTEGMLRLQQACGHIHHSLRPPMPAR
jgi:hypothetical protein